MFNFGFQSKLCNDEAGDRPPVPKRGVPTKVPVPTLGEGDMVVEIQQTYLQPIHAL